jgi:3-phosphoshikimate 1-carboxyvinyltransferase
MKLKPANKIFGKPLLPGDKSISHRCLIFAALATGISTFENVSMAEDVFSTEKVLLQLGVEIQRDGSYVRVISSGKLKKPLKHLDCGNAGTLMRLMMGVLSAQDFESTLIGDESLSARPMKRVSEPLKQMGANINLSDNEFAPMTIRPSRLKGIDYNLPVASAQVKSAIMLAALFAEGNTTLTGKIQSRDHTEKLLKLFGGEIEVHPQNIKIFGNKKLHSASYNIPNDISAASFWLTAGILAKESDVTLENVGVNPTRTGFIDVLKNAGAKIEMEIVAQSPEAIANIKAKKSLLKSFEIPAEQISTLIDEVPLLALIATQCEGVSKICGLEELRYKETDRIRSTTEAIRALGGRVEVQDNDLIIEGPQVLTGGVVNSYGDHRIAMMAAVSIYCTSGEVEIINFESSEISDPHFSKQIAEFS